MLIRFLNFIKNQKISSVVLASVLLSEVSMASVNLDKSTLVLPDGREISLKRVVGEFKYRIEFKRNNKVWSRTVEDDWGTSWYWAYFIPIVKDQYWTDIDRDGKLDVAIGVWGGGNAPCGPVHVFSVMDNKLHYRETRTVYQESVEYAYEEQECSDPRLSMKQLKLNTPAILER